MLLNCTVLVANMINLQRETPRVGDINGRKFVDGTSEVGSVKTNVKYCLKSYHNGGAVQECARQEAQYVGGKSLWGRVN